MKPVHLLLCLAGLALLAPSPAEARPKKRPAKKKEREKPAPEAKSPEQAEADRHFTAGVTLYKENKFSEALAEFQRAYEIAPHPLVLYNIAGCHRELSSYGDAVRFYRRFLEEGQEVVSKVRLDNAQRELDDILARIARVTVKLDEPAGAELSLDGEPLGTMPLEMPLILPPGEHELSARLAGYREARRKVRVASGDELEVELELTVLPKDATPVASRQPQRRKRVSAKTFAIGAAFGTNLRQLGDTGAPSARLSMALGRFELGVEGVFVAYAVVPSLRVRLVGDALSVHLVGAAPIALATGDMEETFFAGAGGLGLRYRVTPALSFRLESLASYAGKTHGTTVPTFIGGELWF